MGIYLGPFADAESVVLTMFDASTIAWNGNPVLSVTATPANFVPPMIQVERIGGQDDGLTDFPSMKINCFGVDRPMAWNLAEQCRQVILSAIRTSYVLDGKTVLIDNAKTTTPAEQLQDINIDFRLVVATYELSLRRPR